MAGVEILLRTLAQRQEPDRKRRPALDSDQCLGPDQLAGRPKQRVTMLHRTHRDSVHLVDGARQQLPFDLVHAVAVCPEPLVADDQGKRNRIDPED